jgi:hypothetical protein
MSLNIRPGPERSLSNIRKGTPESDWLSGNRSKGIRLRGGVSLRLRRRERMQATSRAAMMRNTPCPMDNGMDMVWVC